MCVWCGTLSGCATITVGDATEWTWTWQALVGGGKDNERMSETFFWRRDQVSNWEQKEKMCQNYVLFIRLSCPREKLCAFPFYIVIIIIISDDVWMRFSFFFEIFLARIVAYYESWQAFCGYGVQKIDSSYICFYLCPLILFLALSLEAVPLIVNYDISLFHARHFSEWSHCLACVFWVRRYFFHFCYALSFRVYDNVIKNELHYFVKYARR